MEKKAQCPVCGTENNWTYYTGPFGVEEEYYDCKHCGYTRRMAYSPVFESVNTNNVPKENVEKYSEKYKELGLEINPDWAEQI